MSFDNLNYNVNDESFLKNLNIKIINLKKRFKSNIILIYFINEE
jgi:hypothetical protein